MNNSQTPELSQHAHLVVASVPAVEVSNHADARSVRRPDGEGDALRAAYFGDVRAELFVDLFVSSFAEEMQIDFTETLPVALAHLIRRSSVAQR